jgi:hypothetical protein
MITTLASYLSIAKNLDRSLALKSEEKPVARETAYYLDTIGGIKSIDDFMANTRVYNFALEAFGLGDMAYAKAFIRKVLTEGVSDSGAFANKLSDTRFKAFAKVFDFAGKGDAATSTTETGQGTVDRYVRQKLETSAGEDNPGVRLALYFRRVAPDVSSVYGLLADEALWAVVKTVFGFPDAMANADITRQADAITQRLDVSDLKDPDKVDRLLQRFSAAYDAQQSITADPVLTLFQSSSQNTTIGLDLVVTLGSLKHGGA